MTLLAGAAPAFADGAGGLRCTLAAPARAAVGAPVELRFTLHNAGATPVWVLSWGTPFEPQGWFAPYVEVRRDGVALPYQGPKMKRGEPTAAQYFELAPGASRTATVDLALPFDLSRPGRYTVQPRLRLHDVAVGPAARVPRPREAHVGQPLRCNPVTIEMEAAPGRG